MTEDEWERAVMNKPLDPSKGIMVRGDPRITKELYRELGMIGWKAVKKRLADEGHGIIYQPPKYRETGKMKKRHKIQELKHKLKYAKEQLKEEQWKVESRDEVIRRLTDQWVKSSDEASYNDNRWDEELDEHYNLRKVISRQDGANRKLRERIAELEAQLEGEQS